MHSVPVTGPRFPYRGPFFNCLIVGYSPPGLKGRSFLLTVRSFLLAVGLFCLRNLAWSFLLWSSKMITY